MNNIITEANRRISELQSLLANVKPPWEYVQGRLRISHDKGKVRYYLQGQRGEKDQYLSKKEMARIRSLAQNDYDEKILKLANEELDYLANFVKNYPARDFESLYPEMDVDRRNLISPVILPDDEYVKWCLAQPYQRKAFDSHDSTQFFTSAGIRVRSKSEILIADTLEKRGFPFRIERPLYLEGFGWVYPDFEILDVRTRRTYIWEHHGLLDDRDYRENNFLAKNQYYLANGYFPGINLIQTFESQKHPLSGPTIESVIDTYFYVA